MRIFFFSTIEENAHFSLHKKAFGTKFYFYEKLELIQRFKTHFLAVSTTKKLNYFIKFIQLHYFSYYRHSIKLLSYPLKDEMFEECHMRTFEGFCLMIFTVKLIFLSFSLENRFLRKFFMHFVEFSLYENYSRKKKPLEILNF